MAINMVPNRTRYMNQRATYNQAQTAGQGQQWLANRPKIASRMAARQPAAPVAPMQQQSIQQQQPMQQIGQQPMEQQQMISPDTGYYQAGGGGELRASRGDLAGQAIEQMGAPKQLDTTMGAPQGAGQVCPTCGQVRT